MGIRVKFTFNYYNFTRRNLSPLNCVYVVSDYDYTTKSPVELLVQYDYKNNPLNRNLLVEYQDNNTIITYKVHPTPCAYHIYSDITIVGVL